MMKTSPLSFRVDANIKAALEKLAADDNRSLSSYIQLLLKQHVEAKLTRTGASTSIRKPSAENPNDRRD
jgi:hypothetical protein